MSGVRPRATRSSVQKSPTVTTGFARPIVGRMLGPWTRAPIGHRRYSRSESGSRNVALAKSANAEGELPVDMDAHLLRDLGPRVVHDDDVPLPVFRCLAPAQGALVLVGDVNPIVHARRDVQEAVQRTESHEGAELKDFHHGALDDLLQSGGKDERVIAHPLVDRTVPVDDPAFTDALDVASNEGEGLIRPNLPF